MTHTNDKEGKAKTVIMMPLTEQPSELSVLKKQTETSFLFYFYQGNLKTMSKSGYP
jgi:hypothetical protein